MTACALNREFFNARRNPDPEKQRYTVRKLRCMIQMHPDRCPVRGEYLPVTAEIICDMNGKAVTFFTVQHTTFLQNPAIVHISVKSKHFPVVPVSYRNLIPGNSFFLRIIKDTMSVQKV